eukprot:5915798-Prymnesium_polylepis.1
MFYVWACEYAVSKSKYFMSQMGLLFRNSLDDDFGKRKHGITWQLQQKMAENLLRRPMKVLRV